MRAVAGVSLDTLTLASGSGYNNTLVIAVTERVDLVCCIGIATVTSICCITLILASRSGYKRRVRVSERVYFLCIRMRAVAGVSLDTLALAGGSSCDNAIVIAVTERGDLVRNEGVAAVTGERGVSLIGTGRRSNNRLVRVTERIYGQRDS